MIFKPKTQRKISKEINGRDRYKKLEKYSWKRKEGVFKKVKLLPSKTQHFKAIKKFKIFEDLIDNKIYLLILRTYSAYDSELDLIKSKENPSTFDKFIIEESGGNKNLIGYYHKLPKILNEAHTI